ncbi:unnamed protein product [Euphydryas editha]|uniref:Uncharacterized protein n=1 Tax=Euphydryas editha TaxID=104508 RepID=A0AAU9THC5_EUPED|nr:unnamed protein product [Euphydryas editha]
MSKWSWNVPNYTIVTLFNQCSDKHEIALNRLIQLELGLQEARKSIPSFESVRKDQGYGIIPLKIPSSPASHCTLHTTVGCVGNDECTAKSHSVIRLLGPVRDVIVRPARHHYRPGETITFWILALDHDLRLVRDEIAYVALSDPAGTKVAIWDQLTMDEEDTINRNTQMNSLTDTQRSAEASLSRLPFLA